MRTGRASLLGRKFMATRNDSTFPKIVIENLGRGARSPWNGPKRCLLDNILAPRDFSSCSIQEKRSPYLLMGQTFTPPPVHLVLISITESSSPRSMKRDTC